MVGKSGRKIATEMASEKGDTNKFELEKKLHQKTRELEEKDKELNEIKEGISEILHNLKQAIFTFDSDLLITKEYSQHLNILMKSSSSKSSDSSDSSGLSEFSEGKNIIDFIFASSDINEYGLKSIKNNLLFMFGEDEIQWELSSANLPSEIKLNNGGEEKFLKLSFGPIFNAEKKLYRIMAIMEDITEFKRLQETAKEKQEDLLRLSYLLDIDEKLFNAFLDEARELLHACDTILGEIKRGPHSLHLIDNLFRIVHTIKGGARLIRLMTVQDTVDDLEEFMDKARKGEVQLDQTTLQTFQEKMGHVKSEIEKFETLHRDVLGRGQSAEEKMNNFLQTRWLVSLLKKGMNILTKPELFPLQILDLEKEIERTLILLDKVSLFDLARRFHHMVQDLAKARHKEVLPIDVKGDYLFFEPAVAKVFKTLLIHTLRNIVDHGIETVEERRRSGKNPQGRIELSSSLSPSENKVIFRIKDDGAGLDKEKILQKAMKKGLIKGKGGPGNNQVNNQVNNQGKHQEKYQGKYQEKYPEKMDDKDIYNLIFLPGFSTMDIATPISGRGVGMDVVKSCVEELGGKIEVYSQKGLGTELEIIFPNPDCSDQKNFHLFDLGPFLKNFVDQNRATFKKHHVKLEYLNSSEGATGSSIGSSTGSLANPSPTFAVFALKEAYARGIMECLLSLLEILPKNEEITLYFSVLLASQKPGNYTIRFWPDLEGKIQRRRIREEDLYIANAKSWLARNRCTLNIIEPVKGIMEIEVPGISAKAFADTIFHIMLISPNREEKTMIDSYIKEKVGVISHKVFVDEDKGAFLATPPRNTDLVIIDGGEMEENQEFLEMIEKRGTSMAILVPDPALFKVSARIKKLPENVLLIRGPLSEWTIQQILELTILQGSKILGLIDGKERDGKSESASESNFMNKISSKKIPFAA